MVMSSATPPNPSESAAGYVDAVKWMVGLSGAVFAGIFLHSEQITQRPLGVRIFLALVLGALGMSILGGVGYLLWLNRMRRVKEHLEEIKGALAAPVTTPDRDETNRLTAKKKELTEELNGSDEAMEGWFQLLLKPFFVGSVFGILAFCVSVAWPYQAAKKEEEKKTVPVAVPLHFVMTQSAIHRTKNGMQAHTFLLNQQTGEVWQMVCDTKGQVIAFRRVPRFDFDGNQERTESEWKP